MDEGVLGGCWNVGWDGVGLALGGAGGSAGEGWGGNSERQKNREHPTTKKIHATTQNRNG